MTLDYTKRGEVQKYMKDMTDGFPVKTGKSKAVLSPSTDNIFKVDGINPLKKNKIVFLIQLWLEVCSYETDQDQTFSPILWFYALY